ncbi:hypothetical protein DM02DRAFT_665297 [Periconia macrospinosa]|uniref:Uncharacterized protein n=1 Tax=Periconia macrospinosa TaxID=97972 RepID=A0A2V1CX11_9PLEO|nr:hypothetical protein DM02DRAFT_665297 [Periconia macrospinosa]
MESLLSSGGVNLSSVAAIQGLTAWLWLFSLSPQNNQSQKGPSLGPEGPVHGTDCGCDAPLSRGSSVSAIGYDRGTLSRSGTVEWVYLCVLSALSGCDSSTFQYTQSPSPNVQLR